MISKKIKIILWRLTKRYQFLRPFYFVLVKIKNRFLKDNMGFWVPKNTSLKDFFLSIQGFDYVLLSKEQDTILNNELGYDKDIDLLVNDDDINFLLKKLSKGRPNINAIRVDIYSASGIYPFNFKGVALIPPLISRNLLKNKISYNKLKLLNSDDFIKFYFYKKLYLIGDCEKIESDSSHLDKLINLSFFEKTSLYNFSKVDIVDLILKENGWKPALDLLELLAENNSCLKKILENDYKKFNTDRTFIMYIVRESEDSHMVKDELINLASDKLKIIKHGQIPIKLINDFIVGTRGGNWISQSVNVGGNPYYYIFCESEDFVIDYKSSLFEIKYKIRNMYHKNIVHSTDSSRQALYYLSLISSEWVNYRSS